MPPRPKSATAAASASPAPAQKKANPFDLSKKNLTGDPAGPGRPALTPEERKRRLEGTTSLPRSEWCKLRPGERIQYETKDSPGALSSGFVVRGFELSEASQKTYITLRASAFGGKSARMWKADMDRVVAVHLRDDIALTLLKQNVSTIIIRLRDNANTAHKNIQMLLAMAKAATARIDQLEKETKTQAATIAALVAHIRK